MAEKEENQGSIFLIGRALLGGACTNHSWPTTAAAAAVSTRAPINVNLMKALGQLSIPYGLELLPLSGQGGPYLLVRKEYSGCRSGAAELEQYKKAPQVLERVRHLILPLCVTRNRVKAGGGEVNFE